MSVTNAIAGAQLASLDDTETSEVLHTDQLEVDWRKEREGKITASSFGKVYGTGKGNKPFTDAGFTYLHQRIAERLGSWCPQAFASSLRWGNENEAEAIDMYAKRIGQDVDSAPFRFMSLTDDIGGTPDGLVGDDGCVEVKCPHNPGVHIDTLVTGKVPKDYGWQVHGHLLVTGRQWCDFVSFDPRMDNKHRLVVIRVKRMPEVLSDLRSRLDAGVEYVREKVAMYQGATE